MTAAELDELILKRTAEANKLPQGSDERQIILKEIGSLRIFADAKRWINPPGLKPRSHE